MQVKLDQDVSISLERHAGANSRSCGKEASMILRREFALRDKDKDQEYIHAAASAAVFAKKSAKKR